MASLLPFLTLLLAQYPAQTGHAGYTEAGDFIFLTDEVMQIEVTMAPSDLDWLLANKDTRVYKSCTVRLLNSVMDETILDVGIRPRGNSARDAKKNPWKFSFNEFVPGREIHGLQKMNLGGDAPDPSLARSTVGFYLQRSMGVPAPRNHYAWITINDGLLVDGLYIHAEQIDDEFVDAWFGNEDGVLYKCRHKDVAANLTWKSPGTPATYAALEAYEEELQGGDYAPLADFIEFLKFSDDATFAAEIHQHFNIDGFLRAQAVDMVTGQWDGYWIGGNNYDLYLNTKTNRFEYIPWDLDHAFGLDYWIFPFLFGTNFARRAYDGWGAHGFGAPAILLTRLLDIPQYEAKLQQYSRDLVTGPFHPSRLGPFLDHLESLTTPLAFTGSFSGSSMDNGWTNTKNQEAYYFPDKYKSLQNPDTWGMHPFIKERTDYVLSHFPVPASPPALRINELVAKNTSILADETGTYEDYVELFNNSDTTFDASGYTLTDEPGLSAGWEIPMGTTIAPYTTLLIWCDNDGADGPLHANFKLSASGDGVYLFAPNAAGCFLVDSMLFDALGDDLAMARYPDGGSFSQIGVAPTPLASNVPAGFLLAPLGNCESPMQIAVTGATPHGLIAIVAGMNTGSFTIPAGLACAGTPLGLDASAFLAATGAADGSGTLLLPATPPDSACGVVQLQALELGSCATTPTTGL